MGKFFSIVVVVALIETFLEYYAKNQALTIIVGAILLALIIFLYVRKIKKSKKENEAAATELASELDAMFPLPKHPEEFKKPSVYSAGTFACSSCGASSEITSVAGPICKYCKTSIPEAKVKLYSITKEYEAMEAEYNKRLGEWENKNVEVLKLRNEYIVQRNREKAKERLEKMNKSDNAVMIFLIALTVLVLAGIAYIVIRHT